MRCNITHAWHQGMQRTTTLDGGRYPAQVGKTTPKYLVSGLTRCSSSGNIAGSAASNASRAVNAMKALAGTDWGQDTETLLVTFKALVRPRLEYAAPVWSTVASETSVKRLQTIQNAALRVATGNHLMAPKATYTKRRRCSRWKRTRQCLQHNISWLATLPEHLGQRLLEKPPPPAKRNPH